MKTIVAVLISLTIICLPLGIYIYTVITRQNRETRERAKESFDKVKNQK